MEIGRFIIVAIIALAGSTVIALGICGLVNPDPEDPTDEQELL